MFYVGLDIHDKRIAICALSEAGRVARRAQVRTIDEMMRILEELPARLGRRGGCGDLILLSRSLAFRLVAGRR
jgi:hypothetical protein